MRQRALNYVIFIIFIVVMLLAYLFNLIEFLFEESGRAGQVGILLPVAIFVVTVIITHLFDKESKIIKIGILLTFLGVLLILASPLFQLFFRIAFKASWYISATGLLLVVKGLVGSYLGDTEGNLKRIINTFSTIGVLTLFILFFIFGMVTCFYSLDYSCKVSKLIKSNDLSACYSIQGYNTRQLCICEFAVTNDRRDLCTECHLFSSTGNGFETDFRWNQCFELTTKDVMSDEIVLKNYYNLLTNPDPLLLGQNEFGLEIYRERIRYKQSHVNFIECFEANDGDYEPTRNCLLNRTLEQRGIIYNYWPSEFDLGKNV